MKTYFNFKRIFFFVLFSFFVVGRSFWAAQKILCQDGGFKYFMNYSDKEYLGSPQNWSVLQDKRGIIYVGNSSGVLEYDGVSWRLIEVPNSMVRSLAMDDTGTIYIGGNNQIGFLAPDSKGTLRYKSLVDRLKENERNFGKVWKTHLIGEGIYFQTYKFLFRLDLNTGKIKSLEPQEVGHLFKASFTCGGALYIRQHKMGLMQMEKDRLTVIPGSEVFANTGVFLLAPYAPATKKLLIGTRSKGFFLYDLETLERSTFHTEAKDYLEKEQLSHGIRLSSGDFALATFRGGLVIMDPHGRIKQIFTKAGGLHDNDIKYVFEDSSGNLWLALNDGIAKIEYSSPISIYDDRSGLAGSVYSVIRHGPDNDLYVGTSDGLYSFSSRLKEFRLVQGMSDTCRFLLSAGDSLLAATSRGVIQVRNNNQWKVTGNSSFVLHPSRSDKNRIWVGTGKGLTALYLDDKNGNVKWAKEQKFKKITEEIRFIFEDRQGNLWISALKQWVIKVDFPGVGAITDPVVTRYDISQDLSLEEVKVFMAAGHPVFASERGMFRFDEAKKDFIPDFTLGNEFAGGGNSVFRLAEDKDKNIWFCSGSRKIQAIPQPDGTVVLYEKPLLRIPDEQVYAIYPDPDGDTVWFGGAGGLLHYDKKKGKKKNYDLDFQTIIRRVIINGKPVFDGCKTKGKIGENPKSGNSFPNVKYQDRNLRFEFAAPFFEDESRIRYQTFLKGYDSQWFAPTSESHKEYTNLDAGLYTFRVRAQNVYKQFGGEDVFQFKILPPWYLTWWALLLYAAAFFLVVFFIVKWRSGKLEREKQKLEQTIKERTKEIKEKSIQLEEQSEKLKEIDEVKSRFFANISHEFRTPLTLIMGPIEQMLAESTQREQKRKLNLILRNSQRLLGLINQLLDLSKFESGKMKLQACRQNIIPSLKGIVASFDPVAEKNELDLIFHVEEEDITLYFDLGKLEEVILNLLFNAVKFTPPGGRITVAATKRTVKENDFPSGSLDISVSDTGAGIPREQLAHIFDRFYTSGSTYEHYQKGAGIGLSIAKAIVELHHGEIDVHTHEGKGTEFIIRLPMGKGHLEPEEIVPDVPVDDKKVPAAAPGVPFGDNDEVMDADTDETFEMENDIDSLAEEKDIILVVEDSRDMQDFIRSALEPLYTVVQARDGREGLEKAQEITPDLIISDIMMPGIDGYELCRELKYNVETSHIPIMLLTAKASEESIIQGLETGAADYITKPFNKNILCARIQNLIDLRRRMQESFNREMTNQPDKIPVSQTEEAFKKKLREVLKENYPDEEFNITQMCRDLNMSQPNLYRKIRALTGESPTEFLRSYRLKRGAELLKNNPTITILEVALEVGFPDASYFTKCFKKKFHQLPSVYQAAEAGKQ